MITGLIYSNINNQLKRKKKRIIKHKFNIRGFINSRIENDISKKHKEWLDKE